VRPPGIADFPGVCAAMADDVRAPAGEIASRPRSSARRAGRLARRVDDRGDMEAASS
jgi:hypothetical protein